MTILERRELVCVCVCLIRSEIYRGTVVRLVAMKMMKRVRGIGEESMRLESGELIVEP
mgnify:CR=1 FL=1